MADAMRRSFEDEHKDEYKELVKRFKAWFLDSKTENAEELSSPETETEEAAE